MDCQKNGAFLAVLRKSKGMTQKQVAEKIGVVPKTVSKWETGRGFPDTAYLSDLAKVLDVSAETLLQGELKKSKSSAANLRKTKFFVCPTCGGCLQGTGESTVICCGKPVSPQIPKEPDAVHKLTFSEIEDELYITFPHEMRKEHYIGFITCITFDKVLTVRLYPEQDSAVRMPHLPGGTFYYYCTKHGLFCQKA